MRRRNSSDGGPSPIYTQREICTGASVASYQREQEERAEVGVHDRGVLLLRVVQAGLANAGADIVDEDVQQTAEVFVRLTTKDTTTQKQR